MGRLIFTSITSLDGYVVDASGNFDWSAPSDQVHAFVNDLERHVGTYLYGRKLYDVMKFWQTGGDDSPVTSDYAQIWRAADKVVYSTTLDAPSTPRTRIEREFDPDAVRALKKSAQWDISVGGAHLAAQALAAGLVDEVNLLVSPVVVGGGIRALPDGLSLTLELNDERSFSNGVVYTSYAVLGS